MGFYLVSIVNMNRGRIDTCTREFRGVVLCRHSLKSTFRTESGALVCLKKSTFQERERVYDENVLQSL
jgi:hypothetical protein